MAQSEKSKAQSEKSGTQQSETQATAQSEKVRVVMGNMTWGLHAQTNKEVATKQLRALFECKEARAQKGPESGKILVDTARGYQSGESEGLLGEILKENSDIAPHVSVHTKANPLFSPFTREGIHSQCNESLKALGLKKVQIFYLHSPDIKTSLEETLSACNELYKESKFEEFGLSNYAAWDVVRIHYICKERGWVQPTVYQGCYNAITRSMEAELMPALRVCGMRSYWYNPLAGGFLSGKYKSLEEKLTEGRFSDQFRFLSPKDTRPLAIKGGEYYRAFYFKQKLFDSLDGVREACEKEKIAMSDAAIRWAVHHSVLRGKHHDGIIFGASSLGHVEQNLKAYTASPLPESIVEAFDGAWDIARPEAGSYFRGYGAKSGSSELFLKQFE